MSAIATSQALYATLQGQQEQRGAGAPSSKRQRVPELPAENPAFSDQQSETRGCTPPPLLCAGLKLKEKTQSGPARFCGIGTALWYGDPTSACANGSVFLKKTLLSLQLAHADKGHKALCPLSR